MSGFGGRGGGRGGGRSRVGWRVAGTGTGTAGKKAGKKQIKVPAPTKAPCIFSVYSPEFDFYPDEPNAIRHFLFPEGTPEGYSKYTQRPHTVVMGSNLCSFAAMEPNKSLTYLAEALLGFSDDVGETAEARCLAQTASGLTDDYKIPPGAARIVVTYICGE